MDAYAPDFDELRSLFDDALMRFLSQSRVDEPEAGPLVDEIERLLDAGGKRIRPLFAYWGFRAADARHSASIISAAAALELLHTFAIVHDDIMDAALERRGVATTHSKHGVGVAILVGDLALVLADAMLVDSGFASDTIWRAFAPYSRMRRQVIGGQYLDLMSAHGEIDENSARRIAVLKSGRYSVREPLAIGATLAGAARSLVEGLERFGELLGEAFQLRDDLLGSFGASEDVGKPVDSDIREGKRHVLFAKTLASLGHEEREWFLARWGAGDGLAEDEVTRLRDLMEQSGAKGETEELITELGHEADGVLESLPVSEDARAALAALRAAALDRSA